MTGKGLTPVSDGRVEFADSIRCYSRPSPRHPECPPTPFRRVREPAGGINRPPRRLNPQDLRPPLLRASLPAVVWHVELAPGPAGQRPVIERGRVAAQERRAPARPDHVEQFAVP